MGPGGRQFLQSSETCDTRQPAAEPPNAVANAAQPAAPDAPAPRVANVRPDSYIIGSDDVLAINVWKEPEISKTVPVRPDGMISLPLLGEIKARGLTPVQLEDEITDLLKKTYVRPAGDGDCRPGE